MSNVERRGGGFSFVERRGSTLRVLVLEGFSFRIISRKSIWLVKEEYIYLIKKK